MTALSAVTATPVVAVDVAVFTVLSRALHVLLVELRGGPRGGQISIGRR